MHLKKLSAKMSAILSRLQCVNNITGVSRCAGRHHSPLMTLWVTPAQVLFVFGADNGQAVINVNFLSKQQTQLTFYQNNKHNIKGGILFKFNSLTLEMKYL